MKATALLGERPDRVGGAVEQLGHIDGLAAQLDAALADAGHVEQVFQQPGHVRHLSLGHAADLGQHRPIGAGLIHDVQRVASVPVDMPPWQIVRERRATFAATPSQNAKRPGVRTAWRNLALAGDWTDTGLPGTIESAVRSGTRAADLVMQS